MYILGRKWCWQTSKCVLRDAFDILCPKVAVPLEKRPNSSPQRETKDVSKEIHVERMAGPAPKTTLKNEVLTNLNLVLCILLSSMMMVMILHLLR